MRALKDAGWNGFVGNTVRFHTLTRTFAYSVELCRRMVAVFPSNLGICVPSFLMQWPPKTSGSLLCSRFYTVRWGISPSASSLPGGAGPLVKYNLVVTRLYTHELNI